MRDDVSGVITLSVPCHRTAQAHKHFRNRNLTTDKHQPSHHFLVQVRTYHNPSDIHLKSPKRPSFTHKRDWVHFRPRSHSRTSLISRPLNSQKPKGSLQILSSRIVTRSTQPSLRAHRKPSSIACHTIPPSFARDLFGLPEVFNERHPCSRCIPPDIQHTPREISEYKGALIF